MRIRGGAAGQAIRPEGEAVQLVLVDLDAGTDEQGGTLVMSADPSEGASFELAAEALDRIAQTVRIPPAPPTRRRSWSRAAEGGGAPFSVTYDQMRDASASTRAAPPTRPSTSPVTCPSTAARSPAPSSTVRRPQVVAGLAPALATVVESDAATAPYGGITTPVEGGSLFAYDAIRTPLDVRADDAAGQGAGLGHDLLTGRGPRSRVGRGRGRSRPPCPA